MRINDIHHYAYNDNNYIIKCIQDIYICIFTNKCAKQNYLMNMPTTINIIECNWGK